MKLPQRRLVNWLATLGELTLERETPAHFWIWAGLYVLASALQRKVWLDYGFDKLLPNLYVFLVAPPGKCRKGAPISLAKKLLEAVKCNVGVDSSTKRSFTSELSQCTAIEQMPDGEFMTHSSMSICSKELSSMLVDLRSMIECLTDLFDFHEVWRYKTMGSGKDEIYGPFISVFAATTPSWMANNLPFEAIGDGFISRVVMVTGDEKQKRVPRPELTQREELLYRDLVHDLGIVSHLKGAFEWDPSGERAFDSWYHTVDTYYDKLEDERFFGFIERMHIIVLKVAMGLRVAYSNDLLLTKDDIEAAIALTEDIIESLPDAYGAMGRSSLAQDIQRVMEQFDKGKKMSMEELQRRNWKHITDFQMEEVIKTLKSMGYIKELSMATAGPLAGLRIFEKK